MKKKTLIIIVVILLVVLLGIQAYLVRKSKTDTISDIAIAITIIAGVPAPTQIIIIGP